MTLEEAAAFLASIGESSSALHTTRSQYQSIPDTVDLICHSCSHECRKEGLASSEFSPMHT